MKLKISFTLTPPNISIKQFSPAFKNYVSINYDNLFTPMPCIRLTGQQSENNYSSADNLIVEVICGLDSNVICVEMTPHVKDLVLIIRVIVRLEFLMGKHSNVL